MIEKKIKYITKWKQLRTIYLNTPYLWSAFFAPAPVTPGALGTSISYLLSK